jgi:lysine 2,3-aminomutase
MTSWQKMLAGAVRSVDSLLERGLISETDSAALRRVESQHRIFISEYYLALIDGDDPDCPIRRQAVPSISELDENTWDDEDPIGDDAH